MGLQTVRVTHWVDIHAPRAEVFDLVVDLERRMQLSPLWGIAKAQNPSHDYPCEGSSYEVEIPENEGFCFKTIITAFLPLKKLAYKSLFKNNARVTWHFQDIPQGTRLIYTEEFLAEESSSKALRESVFKIVNDWLTNLRRYAELREGWKKRLVKRLVDRFYLKLQPDQRRTVTTILYFQAIGTITFVMAALAAGLASLFL